MTLAGWSIFKSHNGFPLTYVTPVLKYQWNAISIHLIYCSIVFWVHLWQQFPRLDFSVFMTCLKIGSVWIIGKQITASFFWQFDTTDHILYARTKNSAKDYIMITPGNEAGNKEGTFADSMLFWNCVKNIFSYVQSIIP